jgi:hypothetical protein
MFYRLVLYSPNLERADEDSEKFQKAHGANIMNCGVLGAGKGTVYVASMQARSQAELPKNFESLEVMIVEPNKMDVFLSERELKEYRSRIEELLAQRASA